MAFIRHRQRVATALFPHRGNRRFIVPKRFKGAAPGPVGPPVEQLVFAGNTWIDVPNFPFTPHNQRWRLAFEIRADNDTSSTVNRIVWSSNGNLSYDNFLLSTANRYQSRRGGGSTPQNLTGFIEGDYYSYSVENVGDGNVNVSWQNLSQPISDSFVLNPGNAASISENFKFGVDSTLQGGFQGVFRNIRMYDASDQLIHHWPIASYVPDGGVIPDIVGNAPGVLNLGDGYWEVAGPYLRFASDTRINIPSGVQLDGSKNFDIVANVRGELSNQGDRAILHTTDGAGDSVHVMGIRTSLNPNRAGGRIGAGTFGWPTAFLEQNVLKQVRLRSLGTSGAVETRPPIASGSVTHNPILSDDLQIGGQAVNTALFGSVGIISDVRIFDETATLIHWWPINENVGDGGTIRDVVGGANGTLTLGGGAWLTEYP